MENIYSIMLLVFLINIQCANVFSPRTIGAGPGIIQGRIFSNLDKSFNNFFNRLGDSITHVRGSAEGLMDSAKNDMESFLHKSIDELKNQERQLWPFYNMALHKLNKNIESSIKTGKVAALDFKSLF